MEGEFLNLLTQANESGFTYYSLELDRAFFNDPNTLPELKERALIPKDDTLSYIWVTSHLQETIVSLANKEFLLLDLMRKTLQPDLFTDEKCYMVLKLHLFKIDKVFDTWENKHMLYLKTLLAEKEKSLNIAHNFITTNEDGSTPLSEKSMPRDLSKNIAQTVIKDYMTVPPQKLEPVKPKKPSLADFYALFGDQR